MYRSILSIAVIAIILISCNYSEKGELVVDEYYIIKPLGERKLFDLDKLTGDTILLPPLPPINYYLENNFYFLSGFDGILKYSYKPKGRLCGTGLDDSIPYFIGLKPMEIDTLPSNLSVYIDSLSAKLTDKHAYLISNKDTITDNRFFILKSFLESEGWKLPVRLITEEEQHVFKAKEIGKKYKPCDFEWTNTQYTPCDD